MFYKSLSKLIDECVKLQPSRYANFQLNHFFVEADGGSGYIWDAHFGDYKSQYGSGNTKKQAVKELLKDLKRSK